MKKKMLGSLCVCLLFLFSCKKEQQPQSLPAESKLDVKKYAVQFELSDFEQSIGSIAKKGGNSIMSMSNHISADSLKNHINNLLYLAYDSTGKEVGRIRQYVSGSSYKYNYDPFANYTSDNYLKPFGSIVDSLPSGKYTVVLVGSTYKFTINSRHQEDPAFDDTSPLNDAYIGEDITLSYQIPHTGDTFFKKFSLTVGNQSVSQAVALDRLTGKLEINISDAIPANADKFDFKIYNAANTIDLSSSALQGSTSYGDNTPSDPVYDEFPENTLWEPIQIQPSEKGMVNYQYSRYLYGRDEVPVTVVLRCFDSQHNLLVNKIVSNVRIYKNKRTILKGNLFGGTPDAGFSVSVNDTWDPIPVEVPF